jgi:hypothetical protein
MLSNSIHLRNKKSNEHVITRTTSLAKARFVENIRTNKKIRDKKGMCTKWLKNIGYIVIRNKTCRE